MKSAAKNVFQVLTAGLIFFGTATAQDNSQPSDEIIKKADQLYFLASQTGSNFAFTALKLLYHKYPTLQSLQQGSEKKNNYNSGIDSFTTSLSSHTLRSGYFGDFLTSRNTTQFSTEIDLVTGKHAVHETLQLDTIDPARPWLRPVVTPEDLVENISISTVEPLSVKSHPWQEMLRGLDAKKQPEIFRLVPIDHFVVYFSDMQKMSQLESALKPLTAPLQNVMNAESLLNLKRKLIERLGISKPELFEPLVKEVAFVSEDFDFYPGNNFALVVSFKSPLVSSISDFISPGKSTSDKIGDFLVIASSQHLFDKIKTVYDETSQSMYAADELMYAMAVLDQRRDGLMYLSEKFILKLVSPGYRIQSARRNAVLNKLEALQYSALAYRYITGKFPASLDQMRDENYIEPTAYTADFTLNGEGIVSHKNWGSLLEVKPISEVEIQNVSSFEKNRYDQFRGGYESFWREFFDPVGVAITVSDRILFHTIILPLIDKSEYRDLKSFVGSTPRTMHLLGEKHRRAAFSLYAGFDFDGLLLEQGKYVLPRDKQESQFTIAEKKAALNAEAKKDLESEKEIDLFGMVGDEIVVGIDGNQSSELKNLADVDVYLGVSLKDKGRFQDFINTVYKSLYKNLGYAGNRNPFFKFSSEEPLKNEYKGETFYMVPAGFTNIFFVYLDDYVYFAISQLSINRLIDGYTENSPLSENNRRTLDYFTDKHNLLFTADIGAAKKLRDEFAAQSVRGYFVDKKVRDQIGYVTDMNLIVQTAGGGANELKKYFRWIPAEVHGITINYDDNKITLGDGRVEIMSVDYKTLPVVTYGFNQSLLAKQSANGNVGIDKLIRSSYRDDVVKSWGNLASFAVSLNFTEHGLDTKVVFSNPNSTQVDERFKVALPEISKGTAGIKLPPLNTNIYLYLGAAGALLMVLVIGRLLRRKRSA